MNISKSLEKILEEAVVCGELRLTGRRLKDFPKIAFRFNLGDTVFADLSKNRFTELPDDVCQYPFLEKLIIYHNVIRNIPESVCKLHSLQYLDIRNNQLQSLPKEICFLPLKVFLVSNNRLNSLPEEIGRLETLTELDAAYNQINILPVRMGDLRNLRSLNLRSNQLVYLPRDISALRLTNLDISSNRINTLPVELRQMTSLVYLDVTNNPLTSPPASLCVFGLVHIFKYLDMMANKDDKVMDTSMGPGSSNSMGRRATTPKHTANPVHAATIPQDGIDKKRLPNSLNLKAEGKCESAAVGMQVIHQQQTQLKSNLKETSYTPRLSGSNENNNSREGSQPGSPDKIKNTFGTIQTYKEYKEALKQQRNHEISSVYRSKDAQSSPEEAPSALRNGSHSLPTSPPTTLHLSTSKSNSPTSTQIPSKIPNGNHAHLNGNHTTENGNNGTTNGKSDSMMYIKPSGPTSGIPTVANPTKKLSKTVSWNRDLPTNGDKKNFTMRREFDRQKEETELLQQLRAIIKSRLKINLPEDLAGALQDGVVLCHLANYVRPRSVASIHVPSATTPKLTVTRCRRNVDCFLDACRRIGVDEKLICCAADILEGRGVVQIAITVVELLKFHGTLAPSGIKSPTQSLSKSNSLEKSVN
ncbi:leucine-rich repeat and calponin homology domain-containing protein [Culicoides brevitarsis]|uniref:leucine-rich repeat and calponin homology domain-containing protein n=1 Tax=Culicoides brevitarsis TaxID=469753 RepID=UPI00307CB9B1